MSCGCGEGHDDHGSADNITAGNVDGEITEEALERAAAAQGITVEEARRNIAAGLKKVRR
jgi:hypothetical protein